MDTNYQVSKTEAAPLDHDQSSMLITLLMGEKQTELQVVADQDFMMTLKEEAPAAFIALRRILLGGGKVTRAAALLASVFAKRPGFAVLYAIDVLEAFGVDQLITTELIGTRLYPFGFYTDEAAEVRCDFIKNVGNEYSPFAHLWHQM